MPAHCSSPRARPRERGSGLLARRPAAAARTIGVAAAVAGLAATAAGCGGSSSPSVASLGTTTTATSAPSPSSQTSVAPGKGGTAALLAFAHCMNSHGVPVTVAANGHGISIGSPAGGQPSLDPSSPQFAAAQKTCSKLLPGGGPGNVTPAESAQARVAELAIAQCMRSHGYPNFPDPTNQGVLNLSNLGVDPSSSQFQAAMQKCSPKNGHGPLRIRIFAGPPGSTPPGS